MADIGARGPSGLALVVLPGVLGSGRVYAVEINRDYLKYIEARAERENIKRSRYFRQRRRSVLPQQSVDAALIAKTYHEIANQSLVKAADRQCDQVRGGIIDRNGTGSDHGLDRDTVVSDRRAGFELG